MIRPEPPGESLGVPPYAAFRAVLERLAGDLRARNETAAAERLDAEADAWWAEQRAWDERAIELLRLHHDINNALVGVSGNAQLLMRHPVAQQPGVRERLDVMMRESGRIQSASARLRLLKTALEGASGESRAA